MGRSRVLGGTAAAKPTAQISDDMLVRADVAQKARVQTATFVEQVLLKRLSKERASWGCRSPLTCRRSSTLKIVKGAPAVSAARPYH